jgi:hypothetical protein
MAANITTLFTDSHHVNIQSLQSTTTQTTIIGSPALDPALQILHKNRALEASHTSKTAATAPKCKPGTRVKAIKDITTWADDLPVDPSPPVESVLWLRGPAGAGKTCILREVTRICHERGTLAGDYFFSTRVPGLDNDAPFVATIVSHLIEAIPALDHPVLQTIRSNPTVFEQSLEHQVKKLISNHIATIPPQSPAPRILVIDGFDECRDPTQRAHLLRLLHSLVTPPHSFRVIMASRPELDIRTAFDQPPLKSMTKILHLENYETSGEIYQYLSDEFARIRETHPAKQSIPSEWPGQPTLHALTDKASGIWAYPSTVIKYVDNPRRHPVELLKHVIDASSNASSGRPFAELDALYETILNPPDTDIPLMKRLLHVVVEITRVSSSTFDPLAVGDRQKLIQNILSTSGLDEFLSLEKGTTEITLCDLHSILSVAGDSNRPQIYFHHKSLEDYLCSPERSGNLYQSQPDTRSDILTVCIQNMQCWNRKLVSRNADFEEVDSTLGYLCLIWDYFVFFCRFFPPSILDFDARIAWRCFAFASVGAYGLRGTSKYKSLADDFHKSMVGWINLLSQLSRTHTCFFHHLVQREGGMLAVLRLGQASA